jgi:hypothetical protein
MRTTGGNPVPTGPNSARKLSKRTSFQPERVFDAKANGPLGQ